MKKCINCEGMGELTPIGSRTAIKCERCKGSGDEPVEVTNATTQKEAIVNAQRYGGWAVDEFIAEQGLGFRLGNVVKYISRAGKKNGQTVLDDLLKARVYLDRHIKRLQDGQK